MHALRLLVAAVMVALVLMGVALTVILGAGAPALWAVAVLVVFGVAMHLVISATMSTPTPIPGGTSTEEARAKGMKAFQSLLVGRLALAESVGVVGILLAFVAGPQRSVLVYAVGAAISLLLLALHVWPSHSLVDKVATSLERDGAGTGLREMLGVGGPGLGAP